jgi:hypothetical protein
MGYNVMGNFNQRPISFKRLAKVNYAWDNTLNDPDHFEIAASILMDKYKQSLLSRYEPFLSMLKLSRKKFAILTIALLLIFSLIASWGVFNSNPVAMNAPPAPSGFKAVMAQEQVKLSWEPVAGATHYTIFWGFEGREYNKLSDSLDCTVLVQGLNAGELYSFLVTAWNRHGESDFSPEATLLYDHAVERSRSHAATAVQLHSDGQHNDAQTHLSAAKRQEPNIAAAKLNGDLRNEKTNLLELPILSNSKARKLSDGNIEITQK